MSTELVKVEAPKEISAEQVNAVKEAFRPTFEAMGDLEPRYKALTDIKLVEPTAEQVKEARAVRLALVKTRTGTAGTHKTLKAGSLAYGRYCDAMKNTQEVVCTKREGDLLGIEKHFEQIEADRLAALNAERTAALHALGAEVLPAGLAQMETEVWNKYLDGVRIAHAAQEAAERQAEAELIIKEKAEADERNRIHLENEKLKAEAEERRIAEAEAQKERDRIEAERIANEEAEKKMREVRKQALSPFLAFIRDYDAIMGLGDSDFERELESLQNEALEQQRLNAKKEKDESERRAKEIEERRLAEQEAQKEREEAAALLAAEREAREKLEREEAQRKEEDRKAAEYAEKVIAAEAARAADKENKKAVNNGAVDSMMDLSLDINRDTCIEIVRAIATGKVSAVSIKY